MRPSDYDGWTRVERARWKREVFRERWLRRVLALLGVGLVTFAAVFMISGLTPPSVGGREEGERAEVAVPQDETLRLTVPKMSRVSDVPVYTAAPDNNAALDAGAVHVRGTGFPWEPGANVYIAGHRLGYPNTGSFLVFYDLNRLVEGDRVLLKDSDGTEYVYEVFREMVVSPKETSVTEPVAGKRIVSLQTCTLPDYSRRLIVQAELVLTREAKPDANSPDRAASKSPGPNPRGV
ncbi:sortase [Rubrobacter indicoceani]|uniref:sortase n=1 Tax=Rubrobacter indicoceani TaxID=2051957 RepID=UPI000E5B6C36|nr:sortase [Rubrobacter indicoceani]